MKSRRTSLCACLLVLATAAQASKTITYVYDAKGRIVQIVHGDTVNNNLKATYQHDGSDNRVYVTVTGTSN